MTTTIAVRPEPETLAPILKALDSGDRSRFFLHSESTGSRAALPVELVDVIHTMLRDLDRGQKVTITSTSSLVSTQQAAELLDLSRPTVVRLLEAGEIPFEMAGSHRRIRLTDVVDYRARRRQELHDALDAMPAFDDDDTPDLEILRRSKKEAGDNRRRRSSR